MPERRHPRHPPPRRTAGRTHPLPTPRPPTRQPEAPTNSLGSFFRANPQVLVLLVICLVLGLGTFLAVIFGLITAGHGSTTGEPSGTILGFLIGGV